MTSFKRFVALTTILIVIGGIMFGALSSLSIASAAEPTRLGPAPTDANVAAMANDGTSDHATCGIPGFFGGLLCGFTVFFSELTDASFAMLSVFLEVPPFTELDNAGNQSGTYVAWSLFRGIANGLFVVAFLVIIYAHVTGFGVSNYSIKRMLPRIIVASLLVNLSFYVSSLAVDLSNILGGTIKDLLEAAGNQAIADGKLVDSADRPGHDTWSQVAGSVLLISASAGAGAALIMYGGFAVFLPVLTSAVVAIVTTVLILMIRQVLIIVFIILSPLAFAAMILPNTTRYFDKWKSLFIPILLVFPAVSLLYGAGYIASVAIGASAAANNSAILSIAALGAQIVPLFLTPAVMKLGSGLIDRWGGISQTPGKALRKKSEDYAKKLETRKDLKAVTLDQSSLRAKIPFRRTRANARIRRMGREARDKRIADTRNIASEADMRSAISDDTPTLIGNQTKGEALQQQLAQSSDLGDMRRAKNHVIHAKVKAHASDVEAKSIEMQNVPRNELLSKALSQGGTVSALEKEAAIMRLASVGDVGAILDMMKGSYTMDEQQTQTLLKYADKSGATGKIPFLGNSEVRDRVQQGQVTNANFVSSVVMPSLASDEYSASNYAAVVDKDALVPIAEVVEDMKNGDEALIRQLGNTSGLDPSLTHTDAEISAELLRTGREKLREHQEAAYEALTVDHTVSQVDKNRDPLITIASEISGMTLADVRRDTENWSRSRNGSGGRP